MKRSLIVALAVVVMAVGLASAAVVSGAFPISGPTPTPSVVAVPDPVPPAPTPTGTPTPSAPDTPTPSTTASSEPPVSETPEGEVARVQQVLKQHGYYRGPVDGKAGSATASAVMAFQKVQGLVADGVIGPNTLAALDDPVVPSLRGGADDRLEVDLDKQVLYVVRDDRLDRILPISSGSGSTYETADGGTAKSLTPVGSFTVERHIRGVRNAPLGTLYDPMYFYRGWAIHGSNSVPAYPASHGCIRLTRADAKWLFDRVPIGTAVEVYGNTNAFSPALGESAGTTQPAGDTAATTPDDGIQTEEPTPSATEVPIQSEQAPVPPEPAPAPPPPAPEPSGPPVATTPPTPAPAPAPVGPSGSDVPPPPEPAEVGPAVAPSSAEQ